MSSWRLALRLARRDAAAHRLRTAMTATLVGLPVLFAAALSALVIDANDVGFAVAVYVPLAVLITVLALPAFAVTARSRREQLELIESAGGAPADLRRVSAASGLLIGVIGVAAGFVLAVPAWAGLVHAVNRIDPGQRTVMDVADLVSWPVLAAFALAAATAAAVITALTATGEASTTDAPPSGTWTVVGGVLTVLGLGAVASVGGDSVGIAPAASLLGVGVVLLVPALVHLISRIAGRLQLPLRLATRDADRHRSRTVPAVAAVLVGVAAVTALGIGSFSDTTDRRAETTLYDFPIGAVSMNGSPRAIAAAVERGSAAGVQVVPLGFVDDRRQFATVPYREISEPDSARFDVVVADADTVSAWGVKLTGAERAALDRGQALVGPSVDRRDDRASIELYASDDGAPVRRLSVSAEPASLLQERVRAGDRPRLARAVISPTTAQRLDLPVRDQAAVVDRREADPSAAQIAALKEVPGLSVDQQGRNEEESYRIVFGLLTLLGAGIVVIATVTAVALNRVEGRADAETLTAVGARPRTTRTTAAVSALLISGLGSLLGVAVGFLPGVVSALALTGGFGSQFLSIPWALLGVVGVLVPLLVTAGAYLTAGRGGPEPDHGLI